MTDFLGRNFQAFLPDCRHTPFREGGLIVAMSVSVAIARLALLLAVCAAVPATTVLAESGPADSTLRSQDRHSLEVYYENPNLPVPWQAAADSLDSSDPTVVQNSQDRLRWFLDRTRRDQSNAWVQTPFMTMPYENRAREACDDILEELDHHGDDAVLPILQWVLLEEESFPFAWSAMSRLRVARRPGADSLLVRFVDRGSPDNGLLLQALEECGYRKLHPSPAVVRDLAHGYRRAIAVRARAVCKAAGYPVPAPYDRVAALQSPGFSRLLDRADSLLIDRAPLDAQLLISTVELPTSAGAPFRFVIAGWLTEGPDGLPSILDYSGYHRPLRRGRTSAEPDTVDGYALKGSPQVTTPEAEVARLVALQEWGDVPDTADPQPIERRWRTGKECDMASLAFGLWLRRRGDLDLSARMLVPALDTFSEDEKLVDLVRRDVGFHLGYQMLVAFVGDRDYEATSRLAETIRDRYPGSRFHSTASRLAEQIPERRDDFGDLRLPSPQEWGALKQTLPRSEQIDFLCRRLRLLNCFQVSQPGGVSIAWPQFAEPQGLDKNASWCLNRGKTELINPWVELEGMRDFSGETMVDGLGLTVADIPNIAPYLLEAWYILAVEFWRDFRSERELLTTRQVVAGIINGLADPEVLLPYDELDEMDEAALRAKVAEIIQWARSHSSSD